MAEAVRQWGAASNVGIEMQQDMEQMLAQQRELKSPDEYHIERHIQRNEQTLSATAVAPEHERRIASTRLPFKETVSFVELPSER